MIFSSKFVIIERKKTFLQPRKVGFDLRTYGWERGSLGILGAVSGGDAMLSTPPPLMP